MRDGGSRAFINQVADGYSHIMAVVTHGCCDSDEVWTMRQEGVTYTTSSLQSARNSVCQYPSSGYRFLRRFVSAASSHSLSVSDGSSILYLSSSERQREPKASADLWTQFDVLEKGYVVSMVLEREDRGVNI